MNPRTLTLHGLLALTLAACTPGAPVGLNILNLRPLEQNACLTLEGKKYLALAFNYSGQLDSLKLGFTPYTVQANAPTQTVRIADVTAPPAGYARVLLNESTVAKVYVNLQDAVLSSQGVSAPDPRQTRPMTVRLEASNRAGQTPAALELRDLDVSGCY